jgi:DNA-binding transcriptional ArsR family regulator
MADVFIAEVASLMGDPARANMLCALKDDGVLTATELAHVAGVAPSTASEHLAKLTRAKMIAVRRQGRYRYYRLACDEVADALDSLVALAATVAPRDRLRMFGHEPIRAARICSGDESIRFARVCYDHLAGRLGVELYRSLVRLGYLKSINGGCVVRKRGEVGLAEFGIDLDALRARRRRFAGQCLDWSEQQSHLSGALGAELLARMYDREWLRRETGTRVLSVTRRGRRGFRDRFGIEL